MSYFFQKFEEFGYEKYMKIISLPKGNIVTICPKTFHAIDFHQYCNYFMEDRIIAFRTGSFCVDNYVNIYLNGEKNIMRFSFGIYNTENDIDSLFTAIKQYL
jgi:selenocysteine lyase/cysteine desulfurase